MQIEILIWFSIVLHILTSAFLLFVTYYTYKKMKSTTKFVQKTLKNAVETGTIRLESALKDQRTYDFLVIALEKRLLAHINGIVEQQNEAWASRMEEFGEYASDVVDMAVAIPPEEGGASNPVEAIITGMIEAVTDARGPVGYLNRNAKKVAKSSVRLYKKWSEHQEKKALDDTKKIDKKEAGTLSRDALIVEGSVKPDTSESAT